MRWTSFPLLFISAISLAAPIPSGFPNKGALKSGRDLHHFIQKNSLILKSVSPREYQYGTDPMAEALEKIGTLAKRMGLAPVWIGDISLKEGGKLARHLTHQRGLDADIAYLTDQKKKIGHRFARFHNRFTQKWQDVKDVSSSFLLKDNYQLLKFLTEQPNIQSIYVGCSIYDALEKYDLGQTKSIMQNIFAQKGHEDHFHIRLKCPDGLSDCSDQWWDDPSKIKKEDGSKEERKGKFRDC